MQRLKINEIKVIENQFSKKLYQHQLAWYKTRNKPIRNIIKARQIGSTNYFVGEALIDAVSSIRNQVFFTAKENLCSIRERFLQLASEFGIKTITCTTTTCSSDFAYHITVNGGAKIYICSDFKSIKAQSVNIYFVEYFYIPNFKVIHSSVLNSIFTKSNRLTLYSSIDDSALKNNEYALNIWKNDISNSLLLNGYQCPDAQFRQIVNVDSLSEDFPYPKKEELLSEIGHDLFNKLYMCNFNN